MCRYLTAREAATLAQKSRSQINRDAASGKLPIAREFPGYNGPRMFDVEVVKRVYDVDVESARP